MKLTRRQTHATFLGGLAAIFGLRLPARAAPAPVMVPMFDFAIAGGWHHGLRRALKNGLSAGAVLDLRREAENPYDSNAIAVHGPDGARLGYIPRHANSELAALLDVGKAARVEVIALTDEHTELADDLIFTSLAEGDPILRLYVEDAAQA